MLDERAGGGFHNERDGGIGRDPERGSCGGVRDDNGDGGSGTLHGRILEQFRRFHLGQPLGSFPFPGFGTVFGGLHRKLSGHHLRRNIRKT